MEARRFYLDTTARQFVGSPNDTLPSIGGVFFREDVESIELYFLKQTGDADQPYSYVDYSANNIKAAVGVTNPAALAGTTSFSAISTGITAGITTLTNGGSGANEVQKLTFTGNPPAEGSFSLTLPQRAVTVSSVSAGVFTAANHGLIDGQQVTLSAFSISGSTFANSDYFVVQRTKDTFRIASSAGGTAISAAVTSGGGTATLPAITTPAITNPTAANIQAAFVLAGISINGSPQIVVTGSYSQGFLITFANSQANINFGALTVSSTLAAAPGVKANLNLNTNEVAAIISAGNAANCFFEVEVSNGTIRQTYQRAATISSDIVSSTSSVPVPAGPTVSSLNFTDGAGGTWAVTIDANGVLTATKA